ncbi:tRNA uridine-5-carboxymethylaminomethyl(34) synthesis GTPase MnmE [Candidatus Mycoplasma haematohominis]|uniref:tRNA modification GTPase MnmE n=1 Tax=Candidatus Mycoplasma haematohominis TaxID=1494318 RepID=A0A478FT84_9MOLU|nr:tRNA uridine-5-carboxymethylaminomethyl(34) synthesis GTPase MnmE [Candidatus Mycoplasma haemohominis]GCE63305.1 tRNA modification GTPase MnmE [Candidatus Mycoplasma haemohominis]
MSTIVALATPAGIGALHVIRLSGAESFSIINSITTSKIEKTEDRLQITFIKSRNGKLIDQVVISKYYAPHSYTGEDCIEISCHGNILISKLIIDELIKAGAVHAQRGEFTKRAFLNNKIDLNQALNIEALFQAKTELDIYSSVAEIKGANSKLIRKYLDNLFSIIGECELNVDYPREIEKEDTEFLFSIRDRVRNLLFELEDLLDKSKKQKLSNYRVVFIGKPNAGKSSLVNYLIEKPKIIVSDQAGTTRDAIEVDFYFEGYLLTLVDTAGINSEEDFQKYEEANKSKYEIGTSDLIVHLVSSEEKNIDDNFWSKQIGNRPCIRVITKSDLSDKRLENSISIKNGDINFFLNQLREHLRSGYSIVGIKSQENINYLNNACISLRESLSSLLPLDLFLEYINNAYSDLGAIIGVNVSSFDKINKLFDNFCVGK